MVVHGLPSRRGVGRGHRGDDRLVAVSNLFCGTDKGVGGPQDRAQLALKGHLSNSS